MNTNELIEYVNEVKELECSVYTHERLKPLYLEKLEGIAPQKPTLKKSSIANKPYIPREPSLEGTTLSLEGSFILIYVLIALSIVITIMSFWLIAIDVGFLAFCSLLFSIFMDGYSIKIFKDFNANKKDYENKLEEYNILLTKYNEDIKEDERLNKLYESDFKKELIDFEGQLQIFNDKKESLSNEFSYVSTQLNSSLEQLYNKDIIFPKYRNLVAISVISEYLTSGRCSELEGPNGAYNLYELELRQNIIINQLSSILSNLEQIKNNQYTLYQELKKSDAIINNLLANIGNQIAISNYYAQITADAVTAPKITCGVIF
ncbi:MAG: hypothetical protein IJP34_04725 [Clostridia bacterium]|nr:hypothetical protein [Clostridia bacterium]